MKDKIGEDGKVELITSETQIYDTLSNGKIISSFKFNLLFIYAFLNLAFIAKFN